MSSSGRNAIFSTLDGLRGVAALAVVVFHVNGIVSDYDLSQVFIPHAYLAVDFFFMLSGFVIAYTYDKRWSYLSTADFFRQRLIRLHPLVILAMLIGLLCNLLNPFVEASWQHRLPSLMLAFLLGLLLIASPSTLPNREDATFSLNSPLWSLSLEYCANILYALALRKMRTRCLAVCAMVCCAGLIVMATTTNSFVGGFNWPTLWVAPFRILPPFLLGILCARSRIREHLPKLNFFILATLLLAILAAPVFPQSAGGSLNGLYDALCIVLAFPLLIMSGTSSPGNSIALAGCVIAGRLSYPVYIIHMPLVYVYADYVTHSRPGSLWLAIAGTTLVLLFILLGYLAEKYWDLPLRKKLKDGIAQKNAS